MLTIPCPWCGPRPDSEFAAGGEAHVVRADPNASTDIQWGEYLYFRENVKGPQRERWYHSHGCRRWFNVARDTVTHEITAVYPMGETASANVTLTPTLRHQGGGRS
ncbi:MAG TPA: sarcosine oxidase subunit delta [Burkholderiales bacterium]|nr:sarcosine oxidase subunit delta [Burkholderiales bacterium]